MNRLLILAGAALAASYSVTVLAGPNGTDLVVTKTALSGQVHHLNYQWTLNKAWTPPTQYTFVIPQGQSDIAQFTITATRTKTVDTYTNTPVSGEICVQNTGTQPWQATKGLHLTDWLVDNTTSSTVVAPFVIDTTHPNPVTSTPTPTIPTNGQIPAGATYCFPYTINYTLNPDHTYTNHAKATIDNAVGHIGMPWDFDGSAAVVVASSVDEQNASASLADTFNCSSGAGMTCTPSTATDAYTAPSGQATANFTTFFNSVIANVSAPCGQTYTFPNTAILTPSNSSALTPSVVSAVVYTGTCY